MTVHSDVNQRRRTLTYPSGVIVTEELSPGGRLERIAPATGDAIVANIQYTGTAKQYDLGPLVTIRREDIYDAPRRRLRIRRYIAGGQTVAELRFDYSDADRVTARQHVHRSGLTDIFAYDTALRLRDTELLAAPAPSGTVSPWALVPSCPR